MSITSPVTWLVGQLVPELRRFPDVTARRAALARAMTAVQRHRWFLTVFLGGIIACVVVPMWLWEAGSVGGNGAVWLIGLLLPTAYLTAPSWFIPVMRRSFRQQLRDRGVPICIACGYNLTGNVTGRCPECGSEI